MMVNKNYATSWTYYNRSKSMNVNLGFLALTKNYITCILFIPSEVTTELAITIALHEIYVTNSLLATTKLIHLIHTTPLMLSHTNWIIISKKERGNNMHLLVHQEHNNVSHLIDQLIK
jgi:hypothetical protein